MATANYNKVDKAEPNHGVPKVEEEATLTFTWVQVSTVKLVAFYLLCIVTAGLLAILCVNLPLLRLDMITSICPPDQATMVLTKSSDGTKEYCDVEKSTDAATKKTVICFEYIAVRYCATSTSAFQVTQVPPEPENFSEAFVEGSIAQPSRDEVRTLFGLNQLRLPLADAFTIVILEMLSPFYLFQYFAIAVWLATDYIAYSVIILFITSISIYFVCSDKLFNIKRLHELAHSEDFIEVTDKAGTDCKTVSNQSLVPGDCFIITENMLVPCDAILIRGKIVVDESMLTGESVPVTKTEFVKDPNSPDATKRKANLLYCGTKVKAIGTNERPIGMTYRTGFRSSKGMIIGTLARPQREIISFLPDALLAILFMVVITTCIFGWTAKELKELGTADSDVFIAYLTALTIAVPPGLVACLSIATSISVVRLAQRQISISDTMKLTAAGYVTYACFDKTGTLTDENILFRGLQLYNKQQLIPSEDSNHNSSSNISDSANESTTNADIEAIAKSVMSACHSLSILENAPVGDQLEMELFQQSGWSIATNPTTKLLEVTAPVGKDSSTADMLTIMRTFEYSPEKLRAGVVVKSSKTGHSKYLLKGSPEIIVQMCEANSVPSNIEEQMVALAESGYRVLAIAYRELKNESVEFINEATQVEIESYCLVFVGLVYFQNKLKADTWPRTICGLQQANINVNMITGDHIYTAVAISSECNILPKVEDRVLYVVDASEAGDIVITSQKVVVTIPLVELIEKAEEVNPSAVAATIVSPAVANAPSKPITRIAITGAALRVLQATLTAEVFNRLVRVCSVFARVKPDQKKLVVMELKKPLADASNKPTYVLFCGDGANDMEALSVATVGVSLCDTATTVAASIVSVTQSPYSTVEVLQEGRCSLVTAYVLVLFNIMYAIIQYFMTCFLNNIGLVFGDNMYIVQDLFFSFFLGLSISKTLPYEELTPNRPPPRLFTPGLMFRLFGQLAIFPAFQAILLHVLTLQDWYTKFDAGDDPLTVSWAPECSTLQILALAQLMIASVVVTIGKPFRMPWYTNKIHMTVLLLQMGYVFYLLFDNEQESTKALQNYPVSVNFSGVLIGLIVANIATSVAFAKFADVIFPY